MPYRRPVSYRYSKIIGIRHWNKSKSNLFELNHFLAHFLIFEFYFRVPDFKIRIKRENGELLRNGGSSIGGIEFRKDENTPQASILPALCKTFGPTFVIGTTFKVLIDVLAFVSPQILR